MIISVISIMVILGINITTTMILVINITTTMILVINITTTMKLVIITTTNMILVINITNTMILVISITTTMILVIKIITTSLSKVAEPNKGMRTPSSNLSKVQDYETFSSEIIIRSSAFNAMNYSVISLIFVRYAVTRCQFPEV